MRSDGAPEAIRFPPGPPLRGVAVTCIVLVVAAVLLLMLAASSPGGSFLPALLVLLVAGCTWFVLLVSAVCQRRCPATLVVLPLVVLAAMALASTEYPLRARFALSAPAFDAVVRSAGPPSVTGRQLDDDGWPAVDSCLPRIGLYQIDLCLAPPEGYLFRHAAAQGLFVDEAGFAYLPQGVPPDDRPLFWEEAEFTHLQGPWYAFFTVW